MGKINDYMFFRIYQYLKYRLTLLFSQRSAVASLERWHTEFSPSQVEFKGFCRIRIADGSRVSIGDGFICNSGPMFSIGVASCSKIEVGSGAVLIIGHHSGMSNTSLLCMKNITIGHHVNIGDGCMIMDSDFHSLHWEDRMDRETDTDRAKTSAVTIGDAVFIGARSIICKGVTIGEHTVVAAGSVVVSDIPANCLAGGNPAKVIKELGIVK